MKRSVLAVAASLAMLGTAHAATINVGGKCSLIRAIASANNAASRFCRPGHGADTIYMPPRKVLGLARINNTTFGPSGLPVIRSAMAIFGNGGTVRRAARAPLFRIFTVSAAGRLNLNDLKITGGNAVNSGVSAGGLYNLGFTIVNRTTFSKNVGAIANRGALFVNTSRIINNIAGAIVAPHP